MATPDECPNSPLLTEEQVDRLAFQGHLALPLSPILVEQYSNLFSQMKTFFAQSSTDKKTQYPAGHGTELGYYQVVDEKEYLTLRSAHGSSGLEASARETWRMTMALFKQTIDDLSWALGIPPSAWDPALHGCEEMPRDFDVDSKTLMRLFRYEPNTGVAAAHTDNGLLTLCMGKGEGLQLWERGTEDSDGHWIDAEGPTLLTGVALRALTSGTVKAGRHRVVDNAEGRYSIVFALRPCTRYDIDLRPFGREGNFSLRALHDEIKAAKVNVNAHKAIRDRKWKEQRASQPLSDMEKGG
ncbi:MAG: hypothetical protein M1828_003684 [Chrysothrix sp. TS-e1954]|nr:MAG: hypothetical protein M1828_003684 [Chrysothrix sp. TS-e1954]